MNTLDSLGLAPFDASDYLDHEETIVEYLTVALENTDPEAFLVAVQDVAKARGIATLSENSELEKERLQRVLKPGVRPHFDTVLRLLNALGIRLAVSTIHTERRSSLAL